MLPFFVESCTPSAAEFSLAFASTQFGQGRWPQDSNSNKRTARMMMRMTLLATGLARPPPSRTPSPPWVVAARAPWTGMTPRTPPASSPSPPSSSGGRRVSAPQVVWPAALASGPPARPGSVSPASWPGWSRWRASPVSAFSSFCVFFACRAPARHFLACFLPSATVDLLSAADTIGRTSGNLLESASQSYFPNYGGSSEVPPMTSGP